MNVAVLEGILALAATSTLLVGLAILCRRCGTVDSALKLLGVACFVVFVAVALTHVSEALAILPTLGWGQPRSIGHYIDLGAAVLGLTLVFAGLLFQYVHRAPCMNTRPE